jgi:hypothetical protein
MTRQRFEYAFELDDLKPFVDQNPLINSFILKNPSLADKNTLAELMLDSYQGTIDYDGETIEDSITEIESYFSGQSDQKWLECSWLVFSKDELV